MTSLQGAYNTYALCPEAKDNNKVYTTDIFGVLETLCGLSYRTAIKQPYRAARTRPSKPLRQKAVELRSYVLSHQRVHVRITGLICAKDTTVTLTIPRLLLTLSNERSPG